MLAAFLNLAGNGKQGLELFRDWRGGEFAFDLSTIS
jgi:hypothetical protein